MFNVGFFASDLDIYERKPRSVEEIVRSETRISQNANSEVSPIDKSFPLVLNGEEVQVIEVRWIEFGEKFSGFILVHEFLQCFG